MPVNNKLSEREYYVIDYIMEKCKSCLKISFYGSNLSI
jgi:hypothetical protein